MATLLKVLINLADIKSAGVLHFASEFRTLSVRSYKTEVALAYKKRFEKNRDKLFTFLDHDGVPWNNNNAEHAIKAFALLRNVIGPNSTPKGISEYLVLLSISETCKCRGVDFLTFLRSGELDIDNLANRQRWPPAAGSRSSGANLRH